MNLSEAEVLGFFALAVCLSWMLSRWHSGHHEPWRIYVIIMFAGCIAAVLLMFFR